MARLPFGAIPGAAGGRIVGRLMVMERSTGYGEAVWAACGTPFRTVALAPDAVSSPIPARSYRSAETVRRYGAALRATCEPP